MQHTPSGQTAFDNEVYYPVKADGKPVKGFRNTYKRQNWDTPAYTVTMDNRKISSQTMCIREFWNMLTKTEKIFIQMQEP